MPGGTRPFGTAHEAVVRARPVAHLPGTLSHHTARRAWEPPPPGLSRPRWLLFPLLLSRAAISFLCGGARGTGGGRGRGSC